jgi:NAD+ kinase
MTSRGAKRVAFVASEAEAAQQAILELRQRYGTVEPQDADIIVPLGGDGFILETVHRFVGSGLPIFGMHRGSVGFLMNSYRLDGLHERLAVAQPVELHPLEMAAWQNGTCRRAIAFNEVSLLRESRQAAKLRVSVDGVVRLDELMADGILLSTPVGSTAYNLSAHGPIVPLGAGIMALTPISAFRPRRWRGALLPNSAFVVIEVLEGEKRPVAAAADHDDVRDVQRVEVLSDKTISMRMLFDPGHSLEERILREQFGS